MRRIRLITVLTFLVISVPVYADLSQENGVIAISSRAVNWGLQFPAGDLQLKMQRHSPDGNDHYYHLSSSKSGLDASFYIEPAQKCVSSKDCRDSYLKLPNPLIVNPQKINNFELNKFALVEFLVPEIKGMRVDQMNFSGHYVKDGYWVDMHLSKLNYQPGERNLFTNFVQSISWKDMPAANKTIEKDPGLITPREFKLPGHGILILDVPRSWAHSMRQPPDNLPPTIILRPRTGDEFSLLLTPIWSAKNQNGFNSRAKIKDMAYVSAQTLAGQAAEKDLIIEEIPREKGSAFYVFATDKAPRPQEYPYIIQGAIGVDDLLITTTLLYRKKDSEVADIVLNLFSTARKKD